MVKILGKHWRSSGSSWTNFVRSPSCGKDSSRIGWRKVSNWECLFVHRKKDCSCRYTWKTLKWLERGAIWLPCGRDWWKRGYWRTHIMSWPWKLGCTQRECKSNAIIIEQCTKMFGSRISVGATEPLPGWEKTHAKTVAWSHDMEGHAQKCVERYCELANKKLELLCRVSSLCLDDHHLKKEELESVGELSKSMLTNCLEMIVPGTSWWTWHSMVSEQTGSISH